MGVLTGGGDDLGMAKIGRIELCSCGSGRKVKRCGGVSRGPSEQSLARAFVRAAARDAARSVGAVSDAEFAALLDELVVLPGVDLSVQVKLPKLVSPALGRLFEAVAEDDEVTGEAVLDEVLGAIDTPLERARLARGRDRAARGWEARRSACRDGADRSGQRLAAAAVRRRGSVSYTHLTLPTTPYV